MKKIFRKEFTIGLCVIVALVILFFGIDYLKGINLFKPANFYYASYDNIAGLEVAAPVTIDGYKVGQVREIQFDYEKPGKIKVLLALDRKLQLAEDSRAVIASTLLSGAYIMIERGKSDTKLPTGADIRTGVTPDLMASLSEELMPKVGQILPKVDSLLLNLNRLVADPALSQSIARLDGITNNILLATEGLDRTMRSDVPLIMRNAGKITYNLDTITAGLADLSNELKALPLATTMDNVEATTRELSAFSRQLNDPNSTLGLLMRDPELYRRLTQISADVDSLVVDIKRNPKRYISIKLL